MTVLPYFAILTLLVLVQSQTQSSNICYANCLRGACLANNSLACTACDPGLRNINNQCVTTNVQPLPLTYLKPSPANTIFLDTPSTPSVCTISRNTGSTRMIFLPIFGNSFTQTFTIPTQYNYLRIKFNAILLTAQTYSSPLTLLVNVVPANNQRTFLISQTQTINPLSGTTVSCTPQVANRNNQYGVYFMDYKVSANASAIIVQVLPQGVTETYIAVSNFQVYYGSCHQTCATCVGPTSGECTSCRGLLTNLANGVCSNCPQGFYQNVTCVACPPACLVCQLDFNVVNCTVCRSFPGVTYTLTNGSCRSPQSSYVSLTGNNFVSTWFASERPSNPYSTCGNYLLLGGISIGIANSFFRYTVSNLPVHNTVYVNFNLLLIDQNPQDTFQYGISIDQQNITSTPVLIPAQGTNQCGGARMEVLRRQSHTFAHTAPTATITIYVYRSFMGLRDFQLVVDNPTTDPNCLDYSNNVCLLCRNNLVVANNSCSQCLSGFYLTNNTVCLPCPSTCLQCAMVNNQMQCLSCRQPLVLQGIYCVDSARALYSSQLLSDIPLTNQNIAWTYYPNLQNKGIAQCGALQFIGSSTIQFKFLTMRRQFTNLPQHNGVLLYLTLYQIDGNYLNSNSLSFTLNNKVVSNITNLTALNSLRSDICGNSSLDSGFVVGLRDDTHTGATLDLVINLNTSGKIGIANVEVYLLNGVANTAAPFEVQTMSAYSVSTPAIKGLQIRLTFPQQFVPLTNLASTFFFTLQPPNSSLTRLLVEGYSNHLVTMNRTLNNQEIYYLIDYPQDLDSSQQLVVRAQNPDSVVYAGSNGQYQLVGQQPVASQIRRYIDVPESSINNRSSLRNLFNLFRGCAILALFIGLGSFLLGMSASFDDFFILCQLIFVHIFIQMPYNPPSLRIPFTGLHIVQFLEWLPSQARTGIQSAILPSSLYQPCSLTFQQYYQDVAFARTIYHTVLYLALTFTIYLIIHIFLLIYDSRHPNEQVKYTNYFVHYYRQYNSKIFVYVDKVARFCYFTVVWAGMLQFLFFSNQPQSFHVWNSALTVVFFIGAILFPIVMFGLLRRGANSLSDLTFNAVYEEVRIGKQKLWYYLFRYYKLFFIAVIVAVTYNSTPVIPLLLLIVLNIIDFALIFALKPLGMEQPQLIGAYIAYPQYPRVYHVTTLLQQIFFIIMEIFWLILFGIRDSASSATYMGIGYVICALVIILLVNGLVRLVWGILKQFQSCYLERQANYLSVEKAQIDNQGDENLIINDLRTQNQLLSRRDVGSRMASKKMSYVSKIR